MKEDASKKRYDGELQGAEILNQNHPTFIHINDSATILEVFVVLFLRMCLNKDRQFFANGSFLAVIII